jgi:type IV fimbrial biogenesis protein FimT
MRPIDRPPARGFTLIEMMFAVTVLAVLVSLAVPSLHRMQQRDRIATAANELVAHINLARLHAVTKREVTVVCPGSAPAGCRGDNRWDRGWIVFRDPDRDGAPNAHSDVLRVAARLERLHADSAGRTRIRYQPTGFAPGTNLTIKLCDPASDQARAVIVSNPGRPRVDSLPDHLACPASPGRR